MQTVMIKIQKPGIQGMVRRNYEAANAEAAWTKLVDAGFAPDIGKTSDVTPKSGGVMDRISAFFQNKFPEPVPDAMKLESVKMGRETIRERIAEIDAGRTMDHDY